MSEKHNFKWDAKEYASHSAPQQNWARELIEKLNLKGNESLLDIGCGDGKVTAEIAKHLPEGRVVGIDSSDEMIRLASSKFPTSEYPDLKFIKSDAGELLFFLEFDIVFSNAALHWIIDHKPILRGIYAALKPNGRALIQMGGKGNAANVIKVVETIMMDEKWKQYFQNFTFPYGFYSPEEYEPWLMEAGFKVNRIELIGKDMVHESQEKFMGWFRTTWLPYIHRVPENQREDFIATVAGKYIKESSVSKSMIHTGMQRLEFEISKKKERPTMG